MLIGNHAAFDTESRRPFRALPMEYISFSHTFRPSPHAITFSLPFTWNHRSRYNRIWSFFFYQRPSRREWDHRRTDGPAMSRPAANRSFFFIISAIRGQAEKQRGRCPTFGANAHRYGALAGFGRTLTRRGRTTRRKTRMENERQCSRLFAYPVHNR